MGAPMQRSHNHPDLPRRKITSIALAAPAYGMFFTRQGLTGVTQPCLIFAPGSDYGNRAARHAESIKSNLPVLPVMLYLPGHDTIDLAAPCSENLLDFDGLSCLPPDEDTLKSRFKNFNQPLITFFKATLGDPHPPRPKVNH